MSEDLKTRIESRISYWTNELQDLPVDFTKSAYERMKWIRETLDGLQEIKAKFCRTPRPLDPEEIEMREMLY